MCYIFKGVHKDAQAEWINEVTKNISRIYNTPIMADRRRVLKDLANNIKGISTKVVEKTLAEIEVKHF